MRLKNFKPAGKQVLAKVKYYNTTASGIISNVRPEKDMFAEIVAVGPTVEEAKVGDLVMFGDVALLHLPFEDEVGAQTTCVMANEFAILAYYAKDSDENRIFVPQEPAKQGRQPEGINVLGSDALGEWGTDNEDLLN